MTTEQGAYVLFDLGSPEAAPFHTARMGGAEVPQLAKGKMNVHRLIAAALLFPYGIISVELLRFGAVQQALTSVF